MCGGAFELFTPPFSPSNERRVLLHVEHISAAWRRCETQRDKDQRLKGLYGKINSDIFVRCSTKILKSLLTIHYAQCLLEITARRCGRVSCRKHCTGHCSKTEASPALGRVEQVMSTFAEWESQSIAHLLSTANNDHNVSTSLSKRFFSCSVVVEGDWWLGTGLSHV